MSDTKPIFKCRNCHTTIPSTLSEGTIVAMDYCPSCGQKGTAERVIVEHIQDNRVVVND